jgi:hypothetical protein
MRASTLDLFEQPAGSLFQQSAIAVAAQIEFISIPAN